MIEDAILLPSTDIECLPVAGIDQTVDVVLELIAQAVKIVHLDRPVGDWPAAVARTPADVMGLADAGRVREGAPADLVLFQARSYGELLSRPQHDRMVLRAGRAIHEEPPDYHELDRLFTAAGAEKS